MIDARRIWLDATTRNDRNDCISPTLLHSIQPEGTTGELHKPIELNRPFVSRYGVNNCKYCLSCSSVALCRIEDRPVADDTRREFVKDRIVEGRLVIFR